AGRHTGRVDRVELFHRGGAHATGATAQAPSGGGGRTGGGGMFAGPLAGPAVLIGASQCDNRPGPGGAAGAATAGRGPTPDGHYHAAGGTGRPPASPSIRVSTAKPANNSAMSGHDQRC